MRSRTGRIRSPRHEGQRGGHHGDGTGDARCDAARRQRGLVSADEPAPDKAKTSMTAKGEPSKPAPAKVGLLLNDSRAFQGYTLIAPMFSKTTYLIDMDGKGCADLGERLHPGRERIPPREWAPAAPRCTATGTLRLRPGRRRPGSGIRLGGPAPLGLQVYAARPVYRTTTSRGCPTETF